MKIYNTLISKKQSAVKIDTRLQSVRQAVFYHKCCFSFLMCERQNQTEIIALRAFPYSYTARPKFIKRLLRRLSIHCATLFRDLHAIIAFLISYLVYIFQVENLLADIGGQLGLWIGVSVMTGVEILEFITNIVTYLWVKRKEK